MTVKLGHVLHGRVRFRTCRLSAPPEHRATALALGLLYGGDRAAYISLLPTVLSCAAVLPLLAPGRLKIRLCHLALLAALTFLAGHAAYWHWFHKQTGWPAGYRGESEFVLLASCMLLITPADFPDPALYDRIMSQVRYPLSGGPFARDLQLYGPDGVIGNLVRTQPNRFAADALAMRIALNIGRRDPVGVLRLGWETYLGFSESADHRRGDPQRRRPAGA